jgi:hypothetical protein
MLVDYKQAIAGYAINKPCALCFKHRVTVTCSILAEMNVVVKWVTLLLCFCAVLGSIMPLRPPMLTETFHGIFQSLHTNTGTVLHISHDHFLPIYPKGRVNR